MQKLPVKAKILAALIGMVILGIFGWGIWQSFTAQSLDKWLREQDKPIAERMQAGTELFQKGNFGEASIAFRSAYDQAARADALAKAKWADYIDKRQNPRSPSISTQQRYGKGLNYFKTRMAEAATGLASSIFTRTRNKYQRKIELSAEGEGPAFAPPAAELEPALEAIREGLAASPQNEALRLLRAQIYTIAGAYSDAISTLKELLLVNSGSAEAYNQLGLIYCLPVYMNSEQQGEYREKALAMFEKAALLRDMEGKYMADPQYSLGMYYAIPPADKPESALPDPADAHKAITHLKRYLELTGGATPQAAQVRAVINRLEAAGY